MIHLAQHPGRSVYVVLRVLCCVGLLTACSFPGTVRPTVKIGLVAPFEGRYRYVGYDVIYAVRLALREANEAGGVGGCNVELVAYDDGADAAMAVEQARKLAVDPAVVAAIGHFREETTTAALDVYADADMPLLAPTVLSPELTQREAAAYRLGPEADVLADAWLDEARRLLSSDVSHGQGLALVSDDGPLGQALRSEARRRGVQFRAMAAPDVGDGQAEVPDASVLLCSSDPVTAGEVISALWEAGWEGSFIGGPALAASDFVTVAGQAAEGTTFVTPWPYPKDVPGGEEFAAAYRDISNGVSPGPLALPAYEATWVLLQALERDVGAHGEPTRAGVAAALDDTRREGVLGRITFDLGRGWSGAPLYWYRVGPDGEPTRWK